jgi:hypothetical protein
MLFAQLWQTVESRLSALKRRWWPDPVSDLRAEMERLEADIADTQAVLSEHNVLLEELRGRVGLGQRRAARLTSQVAECVKAGYESQAWPFALELDELHRTLADDQAALRRQEQVCWSHEFHLRQAQRKLDDVRGQLRRAPL